MNTPSTINSQALTNLPLITLHDGRPGLRRGLHAEVREPSSILDVRHETQDSSSPTQHSGLRTQDSPSPSPAAPKSDGGGTPDTRHSSPILDFIASSEALDRYNEIISADGWRLDNYRRNPVFQNAHQYGDVIFTLGKALITEVRGGKLFQRVEFATEINPMAKIAYGLYKGRFLNAVSVGFIPLKWEDAPASALAAPKSDAGGPSSMPRRKYLEQELLEVSAVGIPANPEALQLGLKAGAIEKADIRALLDVLKAITPKLQHSTTSFSRFSGNPAAPNIHARASGVRSYEAQLLQLARALRDALKR